MAVLMAVACAGVFQFTPLREGRLPAPPAVAQSLPISIHAPPRGATSSRSRICSTTPNFNSRPSARGDEAHERQRHQRHPFQFTPLREGRPNNGILKAQLEKLFQFTPLREGRPSCSGRWASRTPYFNSRPSARGDNRSARNGIPQPHFNSRPSARGDRAIQKDKAFCIISIHAPPRGATPRGGASDA